METSFPPTRALVSVGYFPHQCRLFIANINPRLLESDKNDQMFSLTPKWSSSWDKDDCHLWRPLWYGGCPWFKCTLQFWQCFEMEDFSNFFVDEIEIFLHDYLNCSAYEFERRLEAHSLTDFDLSNAIECIRQKYQLPLYTEPFPDYVGLRPLGILQFGRLDVSKWLPNQHRFYGHHVQNGDYLIFWYGCSTDRWVIIDTRNDLIYYQHAKNKTTVKQPEIAPLFQIIQTDLDNPSNVHLQSSSNDQLPSIEL